LEEPYDLLASDEMGGRWSAGSHMKHKLKIVENFFETGGQAVKNTQATVPGAKGVTIIGLSEVMVKKPADIFKIMHRTKQNRHSAETLCNRASSRSHAVFSLNVSLTKRAAGGGQITKRGRLHLVDLSGSESIKRSGAEGVHAREAAVIGQSLLSLGRVIRSLVAKADHVPYRESKLTRILSDSLGGSSYTALILAITPNAEMVGETMSTLSYGMLARNVTNNPKSDVTVKKKMVKKIGKDGQIIEVEEDEGEFIDADGVDEDGGLKSLNGKALKDLTSTARTPWSGSVPIRVRLPGERNKEGVKIPVGNVNSTPRVFHGETVEWSKFILKVNEDGENELSGEARRAFGEIFNRFDYRRVGMLTREQIQAMDYTVGEESGSPAAKEFLARFWRAAKIAKVSRSDYGSVDKGKKGHMNIDGYLKFVVESTQEDCLAMRSILNKAGYSLSFGKIEKAIGDEGLLAEAGVITETQRKVIEEEERRVLERDKKAHNPNSLEASKSKVAYEALEKIKDIANRDKTFDLKAAFKKFDQDGNGTVDHDELRNVVREICEIEDDKGKLQKVAKWEMDAIIELFDPNNDGEVDYSEFSYTFYNRRALTSKDAEGGVGVDAGDGGSPKSGRKGGKGGKGRGKKDPDPVMPPPPKSAGFIKVSQVLNGDTLIEFTPRDERGFPIVEKRAEAAVQAEAEEGKKGGESSRRQSSSRKPLSALSLREVVEDSRGGGGGGGVGKSSSTSKIGTGKRTCEKPRDWQEWVIKSRNTWMREAARGPANVVDLRGQGKPMANQQNASHPRMPKLW